MIRIYTQLKQGQDWLRRYRGCSPAFACILGFTETGLLPGISAAGATPEDRKYTAIADAEFLVNGVTSNPKFPLPPLTEGASPVLISRAVVEACQMPVYLFNAGLPVAPVVSSIDLQGIPAKCVTSGEALPVNLVRDLFDRGLYWGEKIAKEVDYLIIGECVVGGTTTALSVLTGLGIEAIGKVNSSHPHCNHQQKWSVVETGLKKAGYLPIKDSFKDSLELNPFALVAAVGDPMQIVAAGMAIAATSHVGVMLAGGTQMLAVYALIRAIVNYERREAKLSNLVVGTTRWVAEDPTGDTVGLARAIADVPLLATGLNFATSRYSQLRAYERGFVKEGVGAGGCAIAFHLEKGGTNMQLLNAIEQLWSRSRHLKV
jgi:uncharacterized protein (TIGR00303 family)